MTWDSLNNLFERLPDLLSGHLALSFGAVVIGTLISVPLGVLAARRPRIGAGVLSITGLIQTIPSIALLALMVPLLGGMIGFLPAFIALTLYSMLPVLRNTTTGLLELDPALIEAARGVGMTPRQRLWRVELPLALPVIIAGLRTATVWVVGTATLASPVGASSLGNYIFEGLQTRNWTSVLFGCVFAALLAVALDGIIRMGEQAAATRNKTKGRVAVGLLSLALLGALVPLLPQQAMQRSAQPSLAGKEDSAPQGLPLAGVTVSIGTKPFTEQYVLAHMIDQHLAALGATVNRRASMGSTIMFDAIRNSTIDLYVDYAGTIYTSILKREQPAGRGPVIAQITSYLYDEYGMLLLGRLGFENAYGFGMQQAEIDRLGLRSIADLAALDGKVSLGADAEFFARPEWPAVRDAYGLENIQPRPMDATFMYQAVRDGAVDVATVYTTDGRIAAYDLGILADPKGALPPYDAVLVLSPEAAQKRALVDALLPLLGRIDATAMRRANQMVDLDGNPPEVAGAWLLQSVLSQSVSAQK